MRVVSLTCSNTEILHAVGAIDLLVGVDDHSDFPGPALAGLPRVGPDLGIDVDAVVALEPDLVLASLTVPGHEAVVAALQARGLPLLTPEPTCLAHVARDLREIGHAVGHAAQGEAAARRFEQALVPEPFADVDLLVEWWPRPVFAPGRDSWVTELCRLAGARNPLEDSPVKSRPITTEEAQTVDAIAISWCGVPFHRYRPDVVQRREGWSTVPAVRNNLIQPVPEAWLGRPGPRLVEGLAALKQLVHRVSQSRETP